MANVFIIDGEEITFPAKVAKMGNNYNGTQRRILTIPPAIHSKLQKKSYMVTLRPLK